MTNKLSALNGATIGFVTKHDKEQILEIFFRETFNARITPIEFDTDELGTFSGETDRPGSQEETLRMKIEAGIKISNHQLLMASEGSFYPHPEAPFITLNTEMILFKNIIDDWEVIGRYTTFDVSAATISTSNFAEIEEFAERVQFPDQGIILMSNEASKKDRIIYKEIKNKEALYESFVKLQQKAYKQIIAETDMRAMRNPLRRAAILKAGENLIQNLTSLCPLCETPGFAMQHIVDGLACCWCGSATRQAAFFVYQCLKCRCEKQMPAVEKCADPGFCDYCNP